MGKLDLLDYLERQKQVPFRTILCYWYLSIVNEKFIYSIESNYFDDRRSLHRYFLGEDRYQPFYFGKEDNNKFISELREGLDEKNIDILNRIETLLDEFIGDKNIHKKIHTMSVLDNLMKKYKYKITYEVEDPIYMSPNYDIFLRDFNNFPLSLPDLTKAIYILFVKHPKGIDIKELHKYQDELLEIYIKISPRADLDQLKKSVADLVNIENRLLQSHLSRVKSEMITLMGEEIAKYYIITSKKHGSSFKFIPVMEIQTPSFNNMKRDRFIID